MKKLLTLIIVFTGIAAFTSCGGGTSAEQKKIDSLENAFKQRNADYDELNDYLTVIANGLDSISAQEGILFGGNNTPGESPVLSRERIKENIEAFQQTLSEQRQQIAELKKKLKSGSAANAKLSTIITSLEAQLAQKEEEISMLRAELDDKNKSIETLMGDLASVRQRSQEQASQIAEQEEALAAQDEMINEAYVKIGSKSELKQLGLLSGGFLKKSKVDFTKVDKSTFSKVDIRKTSRIEIASKKAKLLTPQPAGSYTIEHFDNSCVLTVSNPQLFWSVTNLVIIQTD